MEPVNMEIVEAWYQELESFSCIAGCTACCKGVLSVSVPELWRMHEFFGAVPEMQSGCPFRGEAGCRVYPVRPFMCRLFGYQFLHPDMTIQPYCTRRHQMRPGDRPAILMQQYQRFCEEQGFVIIGRLSGNESSAVLSAENDSTLARFPELERFRSILAR